MPQFLGLTVRRTSRRRWVCPTQSSFAKMGDLVEEVTLTPASCSLPTGCSPASIGKRVVGEGGETRVIDGPFTESKELIASYALFSARTWTRLCSGSNASSTCWAGATARSGRSSSSTTT